LRNGGKGREKPFHASRRGRLGYRGRFAPIHPRRRPIVHRRPTVGGKGLAILRPVVLGLTVHRTPPVAISWQSPDVSGAPLPVMLDDCPEAAIGVRRRPQRHRGAAVDRSLPRASSADPTTNTLSVHASESHVLLIAVGR